MIHTNTQATVNNVASFTGCAGGLGYSRIKAAGSTVGWTLWQVEGNSFISSSEGADGQVSHEK